MRKLTPYSSGMADMFEATVFDFWMADDEWPIYGDLECQLAFILANGLKRHDHFRSIFIENDKGETDESQSSIRFDRMIERRKQLEPTPPPPPIEPTPPPPPIEPTPPPPPIDPTPPKRVKKSCPFAIEISKVENGAKSVQVICPDNETRDMDNKAVKMLEACILHVHVSSLEMQVCPAALQCSALVLTILFC